MKSAFGKLPIGVSCERLGTVHGHDADYGPRLARMMTCRSRRLTVAALNPSGLNIPLSPSGVPLLE
jgi:hypothetical protein